MFKGIRSERHTHAQTARQSERTFKSKEAPAGTELRPKRLLTDRRTDSLLQMLGRTLIEWETGSENQC